MSQLRQHSSMIILLFALAVVGCKFQEPSAQDASAIYGCYTAPGAPSFSLSRAGMSVEGFSAPIPFRYELRKVGYVLDVPIEANEISGRLAFLAGDRQFYRMVPSNAGPTFIVAFGPDATIENYKRSPASACTA